MPPNRPQAAIAIVLALRTPAGVSPAISLLFCGTHAISLAVLVFSAAKRCTYVALRPYLLAAARAFSDLLCPQLVWHLAAHAGGTAQGAHDTWPGGPRRLGLGTGDEARGHPPPLACGAVSGRQQQPAAFT